MDPRLVELQRRFGDGPVARAAAQRALGLRDEEFENMFSTTASSSAPRGPDYLVAEAQDVAHGGHVPQPLAQPAVPVHAVPAPAVPQPSAQQPGLPAAYQRAVQAAQGSPLPSPGSVIEDQPRMGTPVPHPQSPIPSSTPQHQLHSPQYQPQMAQHPSPQVTRPHHAHYAGTPSPQRQAHSPGHVQQHISAQRRAQQGSRSASPGNARSRPASARPVSPGGLQPVATSALIHRAAHEPHRSLTARITGQHAAAAAAAAAGTGGAPPTSPPSARRSAGGRTGRGSRSPSPVWMPSGAVDPSTGLRTSSPTRPNSSTPPRRTYRPRSPEAGVGWTEKGYVAYSLIRAQESQGTRESMKQHAEDFFHKYRIKQHMDVPDYRFSQPGVRGVIATVSQQHASPDSAHPALADQHYKRSAEENAVIDKERSQAALRASRSRSGSPTGPTRSPRDDVRRDIHRLSAKRELNSARLRKLEQNGDAIREATEGVAQRAMAAIERSNRLSRGGAFNRSRSASPSSHNTRSYYGSPTQHGSNRWQSQHRGTQSTHNTPRNVSGNGMAGPYAYEEPMRRPQSAGGVYGGASEGAAQGDWGWERDAAVQTSGYRHDDGSLADHVARDSGVRLQGDPVGPALTEEEFLMASGAFNPAKYEEYNRQVDMEMERRALEKGYDSDQEREKQAEEAAALENLSEMERRELERRAREEAQLQHLLHQTWAEQDQWMDFYRERLGPREGYRHSVEGALLTDMHSPGSASPGQTHAHAHSSAPGHSLLPPDVEHILEADHFVPLLTPDLAQEGYLNSRPDRDGYASDGPRGTRAGPRAHEKFTPTKPVPFRFAERANTRPKPIMTVKMEQDLAIRKQEEEAAKRYRFKANPVPMSTMTSKYADQLLEAEIRRQINRETRLAELMGMTERPFSFQERDEMRTLQKQMLMSAAKDPNRFQIPFYAKPIPETVKGDKFRYMMLELESKRRAARERLDTARELARRRVEEDTKRRQEEADKQYKERIRVIDPVWNTKHVTKRAGAVPDFNMLHNQWEQRLAASRALTRRNLTVPMEFGTHNARSAEEKTARDKKALEKRQRILMDMALDNELLPETRWPHRMPRGRVRPTPPPPLLQPQHEVADTRANILRRTATHLARKAGHFDDPHDKERRALERARKEAKARAAAYLKMRQATNKGDDQGVGGMGTDMSTLGGAGALSSDTHAGHDTDKRAGKGRMEERKTLAGRNDAPVFYIEARHAQAEQKAREEIEAVLLSKGPAVYNEIRYHEDK